jgi:2-methylisocitrate lyase-like PEP mutase family enzyme
MFALSLRVVISQKGVVYAPGVWDGLSARIAAQAGFLEVCAFGFAIATGLEMADAEVFTASEGFDAVRKIHETTDLPIIAEIDTGYGNTINAVRTASGIRRAGVSAVFTEDQVSPERRPICVGDPVDVTPFTEAVGKVRAVRGDLEDDVLLIARTDSVGEDAMARA